MQDQSSGGGFIVYEKDDNGFFFPVFPVENDELPKDLQLVIDYALELKCDWCMLDNDGFIIKELPFEIWD